MPVKKEIYLSCKDHLISGEIFELLYNPEFDMLETFPKPENLPSYYHSLNYISHTDSRKNFIDRLYQGVKNRMLNQKIKWMEAIKNPGSVLDIGAGTGDFLQRARENEWDILGVEPNESARKLAMLKGVELRKDTLDFPSNTFDVISLWHVLEHVEDLDEQIRELKRLLKKDGLLIIAVPNYKSHDAQYYKKYWAAYDVPRHLWHFSQKSISKLFSKHEFMVVETKPLKFDSYYVSLLSEKYRTGIPNYFKSFYRGFVSNYKGRSSSEYSSLVYFIKNL